MRSAGLDKMLKTQAQVLVGVNKRFQWQVFLILNGADI